MPRPWAPSAPGRSRSPAWAPIHLLELTRSGGGLGRTGQGAASGSRAMEYKDYYKILGIDRGADDKAIKTAYRRLARKHHPDVSKGSAARFQEINEAYDVLGDAAKRQRYDALGSDWQRVAASGAGAHAPFEGGEGHFRRGGDPGGFSEFFQAIFGDLGGGRGRVRDTRRGGLGHIEFGDLGD